MALILRPQRAPAGLIFAARTTAGAPAPPPPSPSPAPPPPVTAMLPIWAIVTLDGKIGIVL